MAAAPNGRGGSVPVLLGRVATESASNATAKVPSSRPAAKAKANSSRPPRASSRPASRPASRPGSASSLRSSGYAIANGTAPTSAKNSSLSGGPQRNSSVPASPPRSAAAMEPAAPQVTIDREAMESWREILVSNLASVPVFHPGNDVRAFHGRAFSLDQKDYPEPDTVWKSDKKPRQNSPDWLTATEYADKPEVFAAKIKLLRELLCASRRTMAYTGAGLSVAAGIGMAAVGSKGGAGTGMGVATAGEPTLSHCVMAELNRQNLLHGWVQQNHDGLPQKAGYKQEDINEIHGSWFDPSNPVVKYTGCLRGDLCEDMEMQAQTSDLVLVLGTSLTGLNADQCVEETAQRSTVGASLGSVIISPQRTAQDGRASLRIFAKADEVMTALAEEFGFGARAFGKGHGIRRSADLFTKQNRVLVPYDKNGVRSTTVKTYWDLTPGAKIHISSHNNVEGARQPQDKGITSSTVGTVNQRDERACSIVLTIGSVNKRLGLWWLETAERGGVKHLPVVNIDAKEMRV